MHTKSLTELKQEIAVIENNIENLQREIMETEQKILSTFNTTDPQQLKEIQTQLESKIQELNSKLNKGETV